jgi:2-oxoglutarate dehydrogenase E2 component (dihydrolipoamide succinyltransferase)
VVDITIPKLNTVDTGYILVEWLFAEGATVPPDSAVAVVETSKAAQELVCAEGGILHRLAESPAECGIGQVIGRLYANDAARLATLESDAAGATPAARNGMGGPPDTVSPPAAAPGEFTVTRAARELIDRHGITADDLRGLGQKVIKSADIEALLGPDEASSAGRPRLDGPSLGEGSVAENRHVPDGGQAHQPPRWQVAIAAAVSLSHRTIPAAHCVVKVEADAALASLRGLSRDRGYPVGIPELLLACIARRHAEFPMFFALLRDDGTAELSDAPRVGVTVDVGTGLSVPVIAGADRASLPDIGRALADLRIKALRRRLQEVDLADGNIALALNDDDGVVAAQPLILPPMACMVNLCSVQQELRLDDAGQPAVSRYFHLGLAYDHRLINGREAAAFLRAVKGAVESPDYLRLLTRNETVSQ